MSKSRCLTPDQFHTADTTLWFRLAYGSGLPLWRVIPHRWTYRRCDAWRAT